MSGDGATSDDGVVLGDTTVARAEVIEASRRDGTVAGVAMMSLAVWAGGERLAVGISTSLVPPPAQGQRRRATEEGA